MKNLIQLSLNINIFIFLFNFIATAQCDPEMEYQSHYFHSSPFAFTPINTNKIEDSEGNFYEILFVENTVIKDRITFQPEQRSPFFTSGVLLSKFQKNGTKIYSSLSKLNLTNIPPNGGSRGGTNYITLHNDTLVLFSMLEKGEYQTSSGTINLQYNVFAKINFNINDGSILNIKPLISSENADFKVAFYTFSMTMENQEIYFSFVPIDSTIVLMNGQKYVTDPNMINVFVGSYSSITNNIKIKKVLTSKNTIIPRELTIIANSIYITGIYTDTVYLENSDILYPRFVHPTIEIARDGYLIKMSKDNSILDFRSIRGLGDVENMQIKNSSTENFYLFVRTTSHNINFEKNNVDTSIETKTYNLIAMNSALKLINSVPIENNDLGPNDFVQAEMILNQQNDFVLSIATNGKNIILGTDTLNTIKNSSNNGATQYHIYFNSEGERLKHQVYYGEGFFYFAPIITNDHYTYLQGSTTADISGSYEFKMPKDAPLSFMTFYEKICTDKLVHTPKIANAISSKIYPNPTHTSITIENESIISNIQILDLMGKVVYQNENVNESTITLDIAQFTNGLYIIKYLSDGKWNVGKVVKQ